MRNPKYTNQQLREWAFQLLNEMMEENPHQLQIHPAELELFFLRQGSVSLGCRVWKSTKGVLRALAVSNQEQEFFLFSKKSTGDKYFEQYFQWIFEARQKKALKQHQDRFLVPLHVDLDADLEIKKWVQKGFLIDPSRREEWCLDFQSPILSSPSQGIVFREIEDSELSVFSEFFKETGSMETSEVEDPSVLQNFDTTKCKKLDVVAQAPQDGIVGGLRVWADLHSQTAWIQLLSVRKEWQGLGVGQGLLSEAFQKLKEMGQQRIILHLESAAYQPALVFLLQKMGFQLRHRQLTLLKIFQVRAAEKQNSSARDL